jgi:hypothetical protein
MQQALTAEQFFTGFASGTFPKNKKKHRYKNIKKKEY